MKFLLDTDILVDLFNDQEYASELISNLIAKGPLFISAITITELRAGFTQNQATFFLPRLYDMLTVLVLDKPKAEYAGQLRFKFNKSLPDMVIAATAILEKCQLVTRNIKDYPMLEVKLYSIY